MAATPVAFADREGMIKTVGVSPLKVGEGEIICECGTSAGIRRS